MPTEQTVEIQEVEIKEAAAAPEPLTQEQAKEAGLSSPELAMAKKLGITQEAPKDEQKPEAKDKVADNSKDKQDPDEYKLIQDAADKDLSKDEEKKVLTRLDKIGQAQYFNMKKERAKRQAAEADRLMLEAQNRVLQRELAAAKNKKADTGDSELDDLLGNDTEENDNGKEKVQEKEADVLADPEVKNAQARRMQAKLNELDAEARVNYSDYDTVIDLSADLLKNVDVIYKDNPRMAAKVRMLGKQWFQSAANVLNETNSGYTAADIAYEIGQLHPKYGKNGADKSDDTGDKMPEEKLNKILKNSERDASSAGLNGGRSFVAVDNITVAQAAKLTDTQYMKLPQAVRERLMRESSRQT